MKRTKQLETMVGLFMVLGAMGLLILAYKVSRFGESALGETYYVQAAFENIGHLKIHAPVKLAGVKIGEISNITLHPQSYRAMITMRIAKRYNTIPQDSSARILTAGLLGSNYIGLTPGYMDEGEEGYLQDGSQITDTYSALILESLIGKFLLNFNGDKAKT